MRLKAIEAYNQAMEATNKADLAAKTYYGKDKLKQIAQMLDEPLKKLDKIPIDSSMLGYVKLIVSDKQMKANFLYIRGKMLDTMSEVYDKMADELLSKAVLNFVHNIM